MSDIVILGIILLIAVLIWRGPKMLPQWGAAIGKGVREARTHVDKTFETKPSELSDGGVEITTTTTTTRDTTNAPRS